MGKRGGILRGREKGGLRVGERKRGMLRVMWERGGC